MFNRLMDLNDGRALGICLFFVFFIVFTLSLVFPIVSFLLWIAVPLVLSLYALFGDPVNRKTAIRIIRCIGFLAFTTIWGFINLSREIGHNLAPHIANRFFPGKIPFWGNLLLDFFMNFNTVLILVVTCAVIYSLIYLYMNSLNVDGQQLVLSDYEKTPAILRLIYEHPVVVILLICVACLLFYVGCWLAGMVMWHGIAAPFCWIFTKISGFFIPIFESVFPWRKLGGLLGVIFSWFIAVIIFSSPLTLFGLVDRLWKKRNKKPTAQRDHRKGTDES